MIGVVVVTHGQLATELVNATETIVGDLPRFAAVSIGWHEDTAGRARGDRAGDRPRRSGPGRADPDRHVRRHAVNLAMTFLAENKVEVITGVNVPMLIKLAGLHEQSELLAVAREMREHGRQRDLGRVGFAARGEDMRRAPGVGTFVTQPPVTVVNAVGAACASRSAVRPSRRAIRRRRSASPAMRR